MSFFKEKSLPNAAIEKIFGKILYPVMNAITTGNYESRKKSRKKQIKKTSDFNFTNLITEQNYNISDTNNDTRKSSISSYYSTESKFDVWYDAQSSFDGEEKDEQNSKNYDDIINEFFVSKSKNNKVHAFKDITLGIHEEHNKEYHTQLKNHNVHKEYNGWGSGGSVGALSLAAHSNTISSILSEQHNKRKNYPYAQIFWGHLSNLNQIKKWHPKTYEALSNYKDASTVFLDSSIQLWADKNLSKAIYDDLINPVKEGDQTWNGIGRMNYILKNNNLPEGNLKTLQSDIFETMSFLNKNGEDVQKMFKNMQTALENKKDQMRLINVLQSEYFIKSINLMICPKEELAQIVTGGKFKYEDLSKEQRSNFCDNTMIKNNILLKTPHLVSILKDLSNFAVVHKIKSLELEKMSEYLELLTKTANKDKKISPSF